MDVKGHAPDRNGQATSVSNVVADILKAGKEQRLELDESTVRLVVEQDTLSRLHELLAVNREKYDFKYKVFFHNHGAQQLIAFYRLGANARKMEEAFVDGSAHYEPALKSQGRVNADNWDSLIGVDVPPLGPPDMSKPKPATHYNDYVEFFTAEIAAKGAKPVIDMVAPKVCDGVAGDLAHAIIELGYSFELPTESGEPDSALLARGLAWMCVWCQPLPGMNTTPSTKRAPGGENLTISNKDPSAMWEQIRADKRIPRMTTKTGQIGFYENLGCLADTPGMPEILGDYDFEIGPEDDPIVAARKVSDAVILAFGATKFADFFVLHLATGMRAVESTLPWLDDPELQRRMVRAFWKVCVFVYVGRGAPSTENSAEYMSTEGLRSWDEIVEAVLAQTDSHLAKLVFLSRDFFFGAAKGNVAYQVMADRATRYMEAGRFWVQS